MKDYKDTSFWFSKVFRKEENIYVVRSKKGEKKHGQHQN